MDPVNFPEANQRFGPPEGMDESQVRTIYANTGTVEGGNIDGSARVIVAWKPSAEDIAALRGGGLVYLTVMGVNLPPHMLSTHFDLASFKNT